MTTGYLFCRMGTESKGKEKKRKGYFMKYTSAEANKLLKGIEGRIADIRRKEDLTSNFLVAAGEDVESLRPQYDFAATQQELEELEAKLRVVKHAINTFNLTHTLPGFDALTIDQALVYIPQLTRRISKLREMSSVLPKQRIVDRYSSANFVDYQVSNYDIEEAEQAYVKAKELLAELHLALDTVNTTETMDIDIVLED